MDNQKNYLYAIGALALVALVAVFSKKNGGGGGSKGGAGGTVSPGAGFPPSALSDSDARAIASKLVNLLVNSWYIGDEESASVKALFSHITDEGGYRMVYNYFGYHESTLPGYPDGDLDAWMTRINEPYKSQCRRPGTTF